MSVEHGTDQHDTYDVDRVYLCSKDESLNICLQDRYRALTATYSRKVGATRETSHQG
jgi:hypothetical protein